MGRLTNVLAVALSILAGSTVSAQVVDDARLLVELNNARSDPPRYALGLIEYRSYFHGKLLRYPGSGADIETDEGVAVVDEALAYVRQQSSLDKLQPSALLRAAAAMHLADQQHSGAVGHVGSDGSSPGIRVKQVGGGPFVAEIISYGSIDAADAMRQLIVDDGVADRGHRSIVYSPELRYAGAACGPHPVYRTMCVIDLGMTADGRAPLAIIRYASR